MRRFEHFGGLNQRVCGLILASALVLSSASMIFAPAGDCAPLATSLTRPPSITMVVAPNILPLAVSMRWPHCKAVAGAVVVAGASAAAATPTASTAPMAAASANEGRRSICGYGIRSSLCVGQLARFIGAFQGGHSNIGVRVVQLRVPLEAIDSIACSSTLAPASKSRGSALSASL